MGPRKALAALILAPALAFAQPLAITGVTLIDGTNAPAQPGMTVLVDGERIAALGQTAAMTLPADAQIVDGAGKFLIPGLWDMHVHWEEADFLPLFTANGVTGVRMMWGQPYHLEWRKNGIGPRLALAGTIVDGPRRAARRRSPAGHPQHPPHRRRGRGRQAARPRRPRAHARRC